MSLKNLPSRWYEIESDATTSLIHSQQKRNGGGNSTVVDRGGGPPIGTTMHTLPGYYLQLESRVF